jgi:hypothetical protein
MTSGSMDTTTARIRPSVILALVKTRLRGSTQHVVESRGTLLPSHLGIHSAAGMTTHAHVGRRR